MINNLSQLKKHIENGGTYEILEHNVFPNSVGEIRQASTTQTNGFYVKAINKDNECRTNQGNNGRGLFVLYGKASEYVFEKDTITRLFKDKSFWYKFRIL